MLEIFVSTDVETDGPVAGKHSILSLGSAAYTAEKEMFSTFSANLETLPNVPPDSKTAAWRLTQPEAWSACRQNLEIIPPCSPLLHRAHDDTARTVTLCNIADSDHLRLNRCTRRVSVIRIHPLVPQAVHRNGSDGTRACRLVREVDLERVVVF